MLPRSSKPHCNVPETARSVVRYAEDDDDEVCGVTICESVVSSGGRAVGGEGGGDGGGTPRGAPLSGKSLFARVAAAEAVGAGSGLCAARMGTTDDEAMLTADDDAGEHRSWE